MTQTQSTGSHQQSPDQILAAADRVRAEGESARRLARDPVNLPAIRNWQEAMGDTDPRYQAEQVAPPAMIQVWTMPGLHGRRTDDDPLGRIMAIMDEAGYTSVVATNCSQTYRRELRVGEQVEVTSRLEEVVGPKRTALGEGWFSTVVSTWWVGPEEVAQMRFRVLKFRPPTAQEEVGPEPAPVSATDGLPSTDGAVTRPVISKDTAFFWEGVQQRELRIQCSPDGQTVRHPPGPFWPQTGEEADGSYVVARGTAVVHSWVVQHHPPTPGRVPPYVVVLAELTEGVRMLGELIDVDPTDLQLQVGDPLVLAWQDGGDGQVLPAWRRAEQEASA